MPLPRCHREKLPVNQRIKQNRSVASLRASIRLLPVNGPSQSEKRPCSSGRWTLRSLTRNVSASEVQCREDYFFSSAVEAVAFFSYSSFTSQHFDLRNSLFSRPFFSAHLWASSSVFAFGQSDLHVVTRLADSSLAKAWRWLRLRASPTITNKFFMSTPFGKCCCEFDNLPLLHYYASMYQMKTEPTDVFQALSDMTRLRIMRVMVSMPKEEICLCEVTDALKEPEPNVSRHLKALRQSGLLAAEKEGRWVYHRLVPSEAAHLFYNVVRSLPDTEGLFAKDLARFRLELKKRTSARCKRTSEAPASLRKQQRT